MMLARMKTGDRILICFLSVFLLSFSIVVNARDNVTCGRIANGYGPFDYTNPQHFRKKLAIVEGAHFTREVERLIKGNRGSIAGDLDYTLRAFPNHHRALNSMALLQRSKPNGFAERSDIYSIDCYFKRALRLNSKDDVVWLLYGIHLHAIKEYDESEKNYLTAISLNESSTEAYYNLGLLSIKMNKIEQAKWAAENAYRLGYPLPGLKLKLQKYDVD